MANTTIQIGPYVLPACQHYAFERVPQYAEFEALSGIVWRDARSLEQMYRFSLGWEALTPAERGLVDNAWMAIIAATTSSHLHFIGLTNTPYDILPDEKSNGYNVTLYMGAVAGTGFTTLADASLIFIGQRVFV